MARYKLVQLEYINLFNRRPSYFNFEPICPVFEEDKVTCVSLATIDRETTQYANQKEFYDEILGSKMGTDLYIAYNQLGEKHLSVVFNDPFLNHVANRTIGRDDGNINYKGDREIGEKMLEIFNCFKKKNSGLLKQIEEMRAKDNHTYTINDHNYKFIRDISSEYREVLPNVYAGNNGRNVYLKFKSKFDSYKEFRALYLNYKLYTKRLENKKTNNEERGYTR